ncbi:MAG: LarC family nickel insertion protein, partial [Candidatus Heimdallarchaeota archaeon]
MKALVIDGQIAGAAGDMFLGALLDLYVIDPMDSTKADEMREKLVNELAIKIIKAAKLEGKAELAVKIKRKNERAVEGLHLEIKLTEPHRHLHAPQAFEIIEESIKLLDLSEKAIQFSKKAFEILFEAESKAHGEPIEKVHLHEAGSLDTFLDVLGSAYLLDKMNLFEAKLTILPVALGSGTVTFSHGTLSVPAPAVAEIVKKYKIPSKAGTLDGELFTPTGAIIIAALMSTNEYSIQKESPAFILEKFGVGFGTKQFEKSPNALRILVGSLVGVDYPREDISVIETNLDDCSGETIGFLSTRLLELGARDV